MILKVLNIFFTKAFGLNLLQSIFSIIVDLGATEEKLSNSQKLIPEKNFVTKIKYWVEKRYEPLTFDSEKIYLMDLMKTILEDHSFQPTFPESVWKEVTENDQLGTLTHFLKWEMRRKDKLELISMVGEDSITRILKELIPCFLQPIAKVLSAGNGVYDLFNAFYTLLKVCISVAESNTTKDRVNNIYQHQSILIFVKGKINSI